MLSILPLNVRSGVIDINDPWTLKKSNLFQDKYDLSPYVRQDTQQFKELETAILYEDNVTAKKHLRNFAKDIKTFKNKLDKFKVFVNDPKNFDSYQGNATKATLLPYANFNTDNQTFPIPWIGAKILDKNGTFIRIQNSSGPRCV